MEKGVMRGVLLIETFCLTGREKEIQIGRIDWF